MQRLFAVFFLFLTSFISTAHAGGLIPTLELEKKIAYQQGQFGALYERCGSNDERAVIDGSLSNWRMETFRGYKGTAEEHAAVEKSFDEAANAIALDSGSCQEWVKKAAASWHGIVQLSQYGVPVASSGH